MPRDRHRWAAPFSVFSLSLSNSIARKTGWATKLHFFVRRFKRFVVPGSLVGGHVCNDDKIISLANTTSTFSLPLQVSTTSVVSAAAASALRPQ
jgi:hypothetical protein